MGVSNLWNCILDILVSEVRLHDVVLTSCLADFFDGKHNIVLGGSWATISRIAGRKSFVNWYQRNYPYVWAGARLVKDL
jgi:formylglycine-generating enzyme required for sulfatase activity